MDAFLANLVGTIHGVIMNNIEASKKYLSAAYNNISEDNALAPARSLIKTALREIEFIEQKRHKNKTNQQNNLKTPTTVKQQWDEKMKLAAGNSTDPKAALNALDAMLEAEKEKLKKPEAKPTNITTFFG